MTFPFSETAKTELSFPDLTAVNRNGRDVIYGFRCILAPQTEENSQAR
jgi:hypothetical protein